jgi:predicted nucleotidyltransferase
MDFNKLINSTEYNFLRTNEHLKDKIIFLTLGGSHAYGTNLESSDVDVRGCALNSKSDLLGMSSFEQVIDNTTDTTVYSFNKLISLIINCNPNTIEMLGCKPEHYLIMTPIGKELIENKKLFLSRKAAYSFGGYANQQLRRLENALARDTYPQKEKERHIMGSCLTAMMDFANRYTEFLEGSIRLSLGKSRQEDLDTEIFVDVNLSQYPLRDYKNIWTDMNNIVKDYGKLNKRNNKKDDAHLNKHAMHLIRLYLMCLDILEKEEIITYRDADHNLLMSIRNGEFQKDDKTFRPEFFDMVDEYENRLKYAKENSNLPEKPNYKMIEDLVIRVNERVIKGDY